MMRFVFAILLLAGSSLAYAQSPTTESLHKKHGDALSFFFYNNTLRMINQTGDKGFDELIKDIEKMKFLMFDKGKDFQKNEYKKIVSDYKKESFEEVLTSRMQGKNFDVFIKEKNGDTKGMLVLVNDSTNMIVLDIVGKIALDKISNLYSVLNQSSDISERIKNFTRKE
jgi:hypothetical protein